jgi:hypothetical protein
MTGFAGGMKIGKDLREQYDQHMAQKEREAAIAEAKQQYQQQVQQQADAVEGLQQPVQPTYQNETVAVTPVQERKVEAQGLPTLDGTTPPDAARTMQPASMGIGGGQQVADKVIETPAAYQKAMAATRQDSMKIAQGQVGSERDAIDKAISTRMRSFYMDRGDVAMADKWEQYAESREGKRQMKAFGEALRAYNLGNANGFVKSIMPVLEDAYGDGFKMQKYAPVKDKDGNITGYNFEIRNTRTGEVTQNNIGTDQLYQVGMSLGTPEQAFQRWMADQQAGRTDQRKAAMEVGKQQAQTAREMAIERMRQGGRVELEGVKSQNQVARDAQKAQFDLQKERQKVSAQLDGQIEALRRSGQMTDEEIKSYIPRLVIGDAYKKGASPEEAARLAYDARMKSDPTFARKTEQERQSLIDSDLRVARNAAGAAQPTRPAPAQPAAAGGQAPQIRKARDKQTGQLVDVQVYPDGRIVPVK